VSLQKIPAMNIPITDTHQHLIDTGKWPYSWTKGIPQLEGRAFCYDDYIRETNGTGVKRTIFMETTPDAWREEAGQIYELAAQPGSLIGGVIANCHPEEDGFDEYIASIRHPKLVGLRRICHVEHDDLSRQPLFVENVRRLGKLGLTFDLCFLARQLPIAMELVKKCPDVQFILDHCGVPDIAGGAPGPWRDSMKQIAALPNLACKISGVLAYCKPDNATIDAVRPYVEHSIECFGWDRVVWGGDWPVCTLTTTLREWISISREIVKNAAEADQHKLFHENAARIYGLK
jgi:predicted TIM-barrel fold metal-dependent hydrolase